MTYQAREISVRSGAPIELYQMTIGMQVYYWTSADESVAYGGHTYVPTPVVRGAMSQGESDAGSNLELSFPFDHPMRDLLAIERSGLTQTSLILYGGHRGESEFWVLWTGRAVGVQVSDNEASGAITIKFARLEGLLSRKLPRMQLSRTCQNMLYDPRCSLTALSFQFASTIVYVDPTDSRIIEVEGLYAYCNARTDFGYFTGGVLLRGGIVQGFIVSKGQDDGINLLDKNDTLVVGQGVVLYAGCDRAIQTCVNRFDNVPNFNGWHTIPQRNPFEGLALEETTDWKDTGEPVVTPGGTNTWVIDLRGY